MQMRVDQAGQDEVRPVVGALHAGTGNPVDIGMVADSGDLAVADQNRPILHGEVGCGIIDALGLIDEGQQAATDQEFVHRFFPPFTTVSYQATSSLRSSSVTAVTLAGGIACERPACR